MKMRPSLSLVAVALAFADRRVNELVSRMTQAEKFSMLNGVGWRGWEQLPGYYVGTTAGVPRLGIPSLKMQDAGQGFRTIDARMIGQVTSWSCALGLASSWNTSLVGEWAVAAAEPARVVWSLVLLQCSWHVPPSLHELCTCRHNSRRGVALRRAYGS